MRRPIGRPSTQTLSDGAGVLPTSPCFSPRDALFYSNTNPHVLLHRRATPQTQDLVQTSSCTLDSAQRRTLNTFVPGFTGAFGERGLWG